MSTPAPGGTTVLLHREVPRIGYGMGQVTRTAGAAGEHAAAVDLLRHAVDLGVRLVDTADGGGPANQLLAQALGDRRDEVLYATRVGATALDADPPLRAAQRPQELRAAVEAHLRSLSTDHLDVVYLRRLDTPPGLVAQGDQQVPLDDQLAELSAMRDEGLLLGIGLSHVTLAQLRDAVPLGICAVQNVYSLVAREDEPLLDLCAELGMAWIPHLPLGGDGGDGGDADRPQVVDLPQVVQVADDLGVTPTRLALAWQLAHSPVTMLVPAAGSRRHLEENVAAGSLHLDADVLARLDRLARP